MQSIFLNLGPMKQTRPSPEKEAHLLAKYLINQKASQRVVELYRAAGELHQIEFSPPQERVWQFCLSYPWSLNYIDAALAFTDRYHPVRNKIFLMQAILETQRELSLFFLPQKRNSFYLAVIFLRSLSAILKIALGKLFLCFI
jgi:hypothetical protein